MHIKTVFSAHKSLYIGVALVLVVALSVRCYRFSDKTAMHVDEYLSACLSVYNNYGWTEVFSDDTRLYTGREVKAAFLSDTNDIESIIDDLISLRNDNRDRPHTNLYYSCLRISFFGADTTDVTQIMKRGFALNIMFFLLSYFFMYKLAYKLFANKYLVLCALCIAYLSPASVSNTLFMRPYQLQELLLVATSYVFVFCFMSFAIKQKMKWSWSNLAFSALILALTMLAGYFGITYIILLGLVLIYLAYRYNRKDIYGLLGLLGLSLIIACVIYPKFFLGFMGSDRGEEALNLLNYRAALSNLKSTVLIGSRVLNNYYLQLFVIIPLIFVAIGACIISRKYFNKRDLLHYLPLILGSCGLMWLMTTYYFVPYKYAVRYVAPILPVVSLLIPFIFSYYPRKTITLLAASFGILMTISAIAQTNVIWGIAEPEPNYAEDAHTPLFIIANRDAPMWCQMTMIPYLNDERPVEVAKDVNSYALQVSKYDESYVFVPAIYPFDSLSLPAGYYSISYGEMYFGIYNVYKLKKEKRSDVAIDRSLKIETKIKE